MLRWLHLFRRGIVYGWIPLLLGVLWWEVPSASSLYFPPLWVVLDNFDQQWLGPLAGKDIAPSVEHLLAGLAVAVVGGIVIALLLAVIPGLYELALPIITFFRGLPSIALIPPLLLLFGLGVGFKIGIIGLAAVWPVLLNAYDAFASIDQVQNETAKCYRLSAWHRLSRVILPAAGPQIAAGARVALQISLLVMVASEFISATNGIGFVIYYAQTNYTTPAIWSGMVLLGILGVVLNALFIIAERNVLAWHRKMRAMEANT